MKVKANVKEINFKTLVSGDKQGRIILDIVGEEELEKLSKLNSVPPQEQVEITYNE